MADNLINTTNFDQSRNFLELTGLNAIREQSRGGDSEGKKAALQEAAQQFEAIFMKMLLKSMRKAQDVLESDSPFNSESTKFYRDMHDQQMAVELSSNGTLGLSELIVRQLGGGDNNFTPSSVLRNDGNLEQIKKSIKQEKLQSQTNNDSNLSAFTLIPTSTNSANIQHNGSINNVNVTKIPFTIAGVNQTEKSVNFSSPSFNEPKDFVSALIEPAKSVQAKIGVPFQVIIAQAALETGWGQKIIKDQNGNSSNNLFNIKADKRWAGDKITKDTLEFEQGTMVKKSEPFRMYETLSDSVDDYVNFLTDNDRYKGALQNPSNVEHFVHSLQKAGYATDPQYANKIMATLRTVSKLIIK
ncbi:MAG: flagellar assembly peptidoglycan hydrolase FlgJ [Gammaproteobacteria bacterium]|jgi:flagellar protein FlgJ|nr:MAG: flagellar assembly peptidoglycan hydrolase FlgJ [Gammaproteobacteria bacterium]PHR83180.1 MAG: flagellar assembly peptidoglycan hydrolase FlgJ [Colwellia sp.]